MRLSEISRGISTVTSSPCEDTPSRRNLRSLDRAMFYRPKQFPAAWFERNSVYEDPNEALPWAATGIVARGDDDNGGVRDEVRGQDSEQFLEVTQLCAKRIT